MSGEYGSVALAQSCVLPKTPDHELPWTKSRRSLEVYHLYIYIDVIIIY